MCGRIKLLPLLPQFQSESVPSFFFNIKGNILDIPYNVLLRESFPVSVLSPLFLVTPGISGFLQSKWFTKTLSIPAHDWSKAFFPMYLFIVHFTDS